MNKWFLLPLFAPVIILLGAGTLYAAEEGSASKKLQAVCSIEDKGISFIAAENSVTTDRKTVPQSAISLVAIPPRAEVVRAYLYWNGEVIAVSSADTGVDLIPPNGKARQVFADDVRSGFERGLAYSCRADVTGYVRSNGVYRIRGLDLDPIRGKGGAAGKVSGRWALIVIYKVPGLSSKARVVLYDSLSDGGAVVEPGVLKARVGPALVVEMRPKDALFHLKRGDECFLSRRWGRSLGHYGLAFVRSPLFAGSYLLEVRLNRIVTGIQRGMYKLRPFLVKMNSGLALFFIAYALLVNAVYLALTLIAASNARRSLEEGRSVEYESFIRRNKIVPVSILVAAYNEEAAIERTLVSLLRLKYPEYEVIVINDGSKDGTLEVLKRRYDLREHSVEAPQGLPACPVRQVYRSAAHPNLFVIDKENSGKADSLNAGINLSRFPLFCTVDADTILEEDALFQLALPVLTGAEDVVGVTGMVRLRNGCEVKDGAVVRKEAPDSFLAGMQVLEYIRAYSIGRIGWNAFNAHVIVSGAFSLYRKDLVVRLGGYHRYAIGEDVELNMRIQRALLEAKCDYRILYAPAARCFTQAPADFKSLARQRNRWQQGLITTVRLNTRLLFNPAYGFLGMFAMPFYAFLELPAPVLEFFGYIVMPLFALFGMLSAKYVLILLGLVFLYGTGVSFLAVLIDWKNFGFYGDKSYRKLAARLLLENFGFHQLTVFWRMQGILDYLKEVHVRGMGWRSPDRWTALESVKEGVS